VRQIMLIKITNFSTVPLIFLCVFVAYVAYELYKFLLDKDT
jgi:hypothetical protein